MEYQTSKSFTYLYFPFFSHTGSSVDVWKTAISSTSTSPSTSKATMATLPRPSSSVTSYVLPIQIISRLTIPAGRERPVPRKYNHAGSACRHLSLRSGTALQTNRASHTRRYSQVHRQRNPFLNITSSYGTWDRCRLPQAAAHLSLW